MLTITIPDREYYDPVKEEFGKIKGATLRMEHSLISISKWEAKWKKPFLVKDPPKTEEESFDYFMCMCVDRSIDPDAIRYGLTPNLINQINAYMGDPYTATTFSSDGPEGKPDRSIITSEIIYWSMIQHNIPIEFEKWNLNRLLTLIKVCNIKQAEADPKYGKGKKLSKSALYAKHNRINEMNKARMAAKSKGAT